MNKKLLLLLSCFALLFGFSSFAYAAPAANPVSINESFNTAATDGTVYAKSGENYMWNAIATDVFGNTKGSVKVNLSTPALSLTDNAGREFLQFPNGIGGYDRDVNISFNAGVVYGFDQKEVDWYMVFTSTDGSELFRLHFRNGGGEAYKSASLITNGTSQKTDYTFTNQKFTNVSAYVTFNKNGGGSVTFGNVTGEFGSGTDIASVSAEIAYNQSNKTDWSRPYIIDDIKIETVDKEMVSFTAVSDKEEISTEGASLTIDGKQYTLDENGKYEGYYTLGSHSYTLSHRRHETKSGTFTVSRTGNEYSFSGITANKPVLIRAYYNSATGALEELTTTPVTPASGMYSVYSAPKNNAEEKCFLWESLNSVKPAGVCSIIEHAALNNVTVTLNYAHNITPQSVSLAGDSYIYLPPEGESSTNAFKATVIDNIGYEIDDCGINWSLPGETSDNISVNDGIVTVKSGYERVTDDNGCDITVRATVDGTDIYAEQTLHIRNVERPVSFTVSGPNVIKDGTPAEFEAADVKNQYNDTYTGDAAYTITATDPNADIDDLSITPHTGVKETTTITVTLSVPSGGKTVTASKTVTVYGYDFYEPGTGSATYGSVRMAEVGGINSIVWPASGTGRKVSEIPFPEKIKLLPGTKKIVTFDNICTSVVGYQERSLQLVNSKDIAIVDIDFGGGKTGEVYTDWTAAQPYYGTVIGQYEVNQKASARFELITDNRGITTAVLSYNGSDPQEYSLGLAEDISLIRLEGSTGAPDDRYLTLTNIKITDDSDNLTPVSITGDDKIAVVFGTTARKQFTSHVYKSDEGEKFEWSVTGEDGNKINGVSITNDGVLSVRDDVVPQNAVLTFASTTNPEKKAQHTVEITEYAEVSGFELNGPLYLDVNSNATYSVSHIIDEYGDEADMQRGFAISSGDDIATIDKTTGAVTLKEDATGEFVITAAVGNPGKVTYSDIAVYVGRYSVTGDASNTDVDVTELSHYKEDRVYLVTTATADGEKVSQTEQTAVDGHIQVDLAGADVYEVSPIYTYENVGDISDGFTIPICDGTYSFTFKKPNVERVIRGDIYVNGQIIGSNVDQFGEQRTTTGALYTANDIKITGGKAVAVMKDNTSVMDSITVRKTPSVLTRKPHVYLLGDSLVSTYYGTYNYLDSDGQPLYGTGQTGWGETLGLFLGDDLCVTNLAESGSGAAILYNTTFPTVMQNAQPGDYLLIEAGYQDEANGGEEMMKIALNGMADECAQKGIELILVTPNCSAHGTASKPDIRFGPEVLEIAAAHNFLGINLSGSEYPLFEQLGETYWADNFSITNPETGEYIDKLHSSYFGAMLHSKYIAEAIYAAQQSGEFTDRLKTLTIDTDYEYTAADSKGNTKTIKVNQSY